MHWPTLDHRHCHLDTFQVSIWTLKLSSIGSEQCLDGIPRRNSWCCWHGSRSRCCLEARGHYRIWPTRIWPTPGRTSPSSTPNANGGTKKTRPSPTSKNGIRRHLRCVSGDIFAIAGWRQLPDEFLVGSQKLESESSLVRVAQVPGHVELRSGLDRGSNLTWKIRWSKISWFDRWVKSELIIFCKLSWF